MSRRLVHWVFVLAVGWLLGGCTFSYASLGRVTAGDSGAAAPVTGVTVERNGAPVPVTSRLALERGDTVQTDGQTTAVIHFGGGTATLRPNTKVTISSIWTWFGEVFFSGKIDNDTKYNSMGVHGTEYLAKVDADSEHAVVTVLDGQVTVRSKTQRFAPTAVTAGHRLTIEPGAAPRTEQISQEEYNDIVRWVNAAQGSIDRLVPELRGLEEQAAVRTLLGLGFQRPRVERTPASEAEIGKVVSHSPAPGRRGLRVTLTVGARGIGVPDLRGLTVDEAKRALPAGLVLGEPRFEATGAQQVGRIARQSPGSARPVVEGTRIEVVVEAAPPEVTPEQPVEPETPETPETPESTQPLPTPEVQVCVVPDVSKAVSQQAVQAALERAGFVPDVRVQQTAGGTYMVIESVDPQSGSQAPCGSTVTVLVYYVVG
jgi:beta-lactam-binding protein with PASTA domain